MFFGGYKKTRVGRKTKYILNFFYIYNVNIFWFSTTTYSTILVFTIPRTANNQVQS